MAFDLYNASQANRGMELEVEIEAAIHTYKHNRVALIQKVPTPIKPVKVNYKRGMILQAFFEKKSTVDYIGNYRGQMLAFDAKETSTKNLPLSNIEDHQFEFMRMNDEMGGISFLIVSFTAEGEIFYLPFQQLEEYWILARRGGRKSIPYSDFHSEIRPRGLIRLDFLPNIEEDRKGREDIGRQRAAGT